VWNVVPITFVFKYTVFTSFKVKHTFLQVSLLGQTERSLLGARICTICHLILDGQTIVCIFMKVSSFVGFVADETCLNGV